MVRLISYPFRLGINGSVVTTDEGEDYYGDELAMLMKTVPGERELVPTYGIEDPTFDEYNVHELIEKISTFGPPVDIVDTTTTYLSNGRVNVNVIFKEIPMDDEDVANTSSDNESDDDNYDTDDDDDFSNPDYNFTDDFDVLDGA